MPGPDLFTRTIEHYLSPVQPFLDDPAVAEVMINGPFEIYVERHGSLEKTNARFADREAYDAAINNVLQYTGKSLAEDNPLIDTRLPDGSRVHVAREPCARHGMAVTIRKFAKSVLDIDWLVHLGSITREAADYLRLAVHAEQNLLVTGGTSSGKTSLLNALSKFIPPGQRIVVIEDSAELQLQQDHVVSLETRAADRFGRGAVGISDLFRSSLRLRPDRIIIGEVRGGEALDMIQAMTSGHGGSMGTLHANAPVDAINRLETLALMSEVELPLYALRAQIASAIDVIVQLSRQVGGQRRVTHVSEVTPDPDAAGDQRPYRVTDIFRLAPPEAPETPDPAADAEHAHQRMTLQWTGRRSAFADLLQPDHQPWITEAIQPIFNMDNTTPKT